MFAKDKIDVNIALESLAYHPGQVVSGHLNVSVSSQVECTAVRVKIECVQDTRVTVGSGKNRRTYHEQVYFVKHYITCYGFSKQSGRKGGCFLSPGTNYAYDFQYQLPYSAPGTVAFSTTDSSCDIEWTVTGVVDIPNGFDKEMEQVIFVTTPAPSAQALSGPCIIAPISQDIASCGCTGCYCCSTGESIQVTPIVSHPIVLTGDTYSNGERADVFGVRLEVVNTASKVVLKTARAVLNQIVTVYAEGRSKQSTTRLGKIEVGPDSATGEVAQEEYAVFAATMAIDTRDIAPYMCTPLFQVETVLVIDFPHAKVKEAEFHNTIYVATGEDTSNTVPPMPGNNFYITGETEQQL